MLARFIWWVKLLVRTTDMAAMLRVRGTRVNEDNTAANGTSIVYTVSSGTLFYLQAATFHVRQGSNVTNWCDMHVRDASDVLQYRIFRHYTSGWKGDWCNSVCFPNFSVLPANYEICVYSADGNIRVWGYVQGYEE